MQCEKIFKIKKIRKCTDFLLKLVIKFENNYLKTNKIMSFKYLLTDYFTYITYF